MLKPKKSSIRHSGAAAQARHQEKLILIFEHLLRWQMIDLYTCMQILNIKKTTASQTISSLKRRGILQEIPSPGTPAKPLILTKLGAETAAKHTNIYEFPEPTIHPSRIRSQQIGHDFLAMSTTNELFFNRKEHEDYFFGGPYTYNDKAYKRGHFRMFSDRELRSMLSEWRSTDRQENAPVECSGKLADGVITLRNKKKELMGITFIEVQESYERPQRVIENFEIYLNKMTAGNSAEYDDKTPACSVIYASTNPQILDYFKEKLLSIDTKHYQDRAGNEINKEQHFYFHDLSHIKNRYSY